MAFYVRLLISLLFFQVSNLILRSHLQTPDAQLPRDHSTDFVRQIFLPDQYALNQSSHAGPSTIYNGQVGLHYSGGVQRAPDPPKSLGYRVEAGTSIIPKHIHNPQSSFSTPFAGGFNPPVIHNDFLTSSIGQYNLNRVPQAGPPSIPVGQVSSYVGEVQDTYFHSLNSLGCHVDAGHPAIAIYPHHGQPSHLSHLYSTKAPVTSSSRQTLTDIQPGQEELYSRDAQAAQHYTLDFVILPGPPEPRQRRSKDNRQQPYNKAKKGTRRSKESSLAILHPIPSSIIPSSDVIATAKADFRLLQAMVCPILIGGQACGQSIGSAKEMVAHLSMSHNVYRDKRKTANADLEGRCPLCDVQMDGGSIHRHLTRHFYYYICPVEVCHKKFSRSYEIRAHCKTHGFEMSDNEDFAVRK